MLRETEDLTTQEFRRNIQDTVIFYDMLIAPIQGALQHAGSTQLVIIPQGILDK